MTFLLDSSAVLAYMRSEAGCQRVQQLFQQPETSVLLCSVTLAEVARRLRQLGASSEQAWERVNLFLQLVDETVPVDETVARESDRLVSGATSRLPLIDALIAAAALTRQAVLVHRDIHFRHIPPGLLQQLDLTPT